MAVILRIVSGLDLLLRQPRRQCKKVVSNHMPLAEGCMTSINQETANMQQGLLGKTK